MAIELLAECFQIWKSRFKNPYGKAKELEWPKEFLKRRVMYKFNAYYKIIIIKTVILAKGKIN